MMSANPEQLEVFPDQINLRKIDPATNTRRFYLMTAQRDLFGRGQLTIEFGRIGQAGRVLVRHYTDEAKAIDSLATQMNRKRKRGYQ